MKRTINSTGRKRLPQSAMTVKLVERAGNLPRSFVAHFGDLASHGIPPNARIFVEPYVASSSARFDFGTVSAPMSPSDTQLAELDEGAPVLFRVKIIDESNDIGKILASADGIVPRGPEDTEGRKSLLPIRHTNLGEELWQLVVTRDNGPQLWVNNRVPGLVDRIVSDPLAQGLVLPAAIREVIRAVLDADDDQDWVSDWKEYCDEVAGEEIDWDLDEEEHADEIENLVTRILRRFVDARRYASKIRAAMGEYSDG